MKKTLLSVCVVGLMMNYNADASFGKRFKERRLRFSKGVVQHAINEIHNTESEASGVSSTSSRMLKSGPGVRGNEETIKKEKLTKKLEEIDAKLKKLKTLNKTGQREHSDFSIKSESLVGILPNCSSPAKEASVKSGEITPSSSVSNFDVDLSDVDQSENSYVSNANPLNRQKKPPLNKKKQATKLSKSNTLSKDKNGDNANPFDFLATPNETNMLNNAIEAESIIQGRNPNVNKTNKRTKENNEEQKESEKVVFQKFQETKQQPKSNKIKQPAFNAGNEQSGQNNSLINLFSDSLPDFDSDSDAAFVILQKYDKNNENENNEKDNEVSTDNEDNNDEIDLELEVEQQNNELQSDVNEQAEIENENDNNEEETKNEDQQTENEGNNDVDIDSEKEQQQNELQNDVNEQQENENENNEKDNEVSTDNEDNNDEIDLELEVEQQNNELQSDVNEQAEIENENDNNEEETKNEDQQTENEGNNDVDIDSEKEQQQNELQNDVNEQQENENENNEKENKKEEQQKDDEGNNDVDIDSEKEQQQNELQNDVNEQQENENENNEKENKKEEQQKDDEDNNDDNVNEQQENENENNEKENKIEVPTDNEGENIQMAPTPTGTEKTGDRSGKGGDATTKKKDIQEGRQKKREITSSSLAQKQSNNGGPAGRKDNTTESFLALSGPSHNQRQFPDAISKENEKKAAAKGGQNETVYIPGSTSNPEKYWLGTKDLEFLKQYGFWEPCKQTAEILLQETLKQRFGERYLRCWLAIGSSGDAEKMIPPEAVEWCKKYEKSVQSLARALAPRIVCKSREAENWLKTQSERNAAETSVTAAILRRYLDLACQHIAGCRSAETAIQVADADPQKSLELAAACNQYVDQLSNGEVPVALDESHFQIESLPKVYLCEWITRDCEELEKIRENNSELLNDVVSIVCKKLNEEHPKLSSDPYDLFFWATNPPYSSDEQEDKQDSEFGHFKSTNSAKADDRREFVNNVKTDLEKFSIQEVDEAVQSISNLSEQDKKLLLLAVQVEVFDKISAMDKFLFRRPGELEFSKEDSDNGDLDTSEYDGYESESTDDENQSAPYEWGYTKGESYLRNYVYYLYDIFNSVYDSLVPTIAGMKKDSAYVTWFGKNSEDPSKTQDPKSMNLDDDDQSKAADHQKRLESFKKLLEEKSTAAVNGIQSLNDIRISDKTYIDESDQDFVKKEREVLLLIVRKEMWQRYVSQILAAYSSPSQKKNV